MKLVQKVFWFIVLSVSGLYAQKNPNFYVAAPSGLSLREEPNQQSKRLELIPYGTFIESILKDEWGWPMAFNEDTIDGYANHWIQIIYNHQEGYIYRGFLLPVSPPDKTDKNLVNYIHRIWNKPTYRDSFPNNYKFDNGGEYGINYRDLFKTGEIFLTAALEEAWENSFLNLKDFNFQQAYLWFYLIEEYLLENRHILPALKYPYKNIENDSIKVINKSDFLFMEGGEMEIFKSSKSSFTEYVKFLYQNGHITIIWGGHI